MRAPYIVAILLSVMVTSACQKDMPEPEVKVKVIPMSTIQAEEELPVMKETNNEDFRVQHHVKDERVFVECIIPSISFRENSNHPGKLLLYVNGNKKEEISTAAFVIKGLTKGNHHIRLVVVKPNNEPYGLEKEFTVSIP